MRRIAFAVLSVIGFILLVMPLNSAPLRVLFIGNSFTHMHNFSQMVAELAASTHDSIVTDFSAVDSYTLEKHSSYDTTISKIKAGCWDYVVLQEQSQRPVMDISTFENKTLYYALNLQKLIYDHNPNVRIMLLMTWARKYGDTELCGKLPQMCTYNGMQDKLIERYNILGRDLGAIVVPCGIAWQWFQNENIINLYESDLKHPNIIGSYLNACMFYSVLLGKTPCGIAYNPAMLSDGMLHTLQDVAYITALKYLPVWFKYKG